MGIKLVGAKSLLEPQSEPAGSLCGDRWMAAAVPGRKEESDQPEGSVASTGPSVHLEQLKERPGNTGTARITRRSKT